ncbi:hypothetical protein HD554DRAFT_2178551 [Boletus coccyginus]|nr:hypothetical protein HD554DRAFT_2178551 [Boletus coccyginus]
MSSYPARLSFPIEGTLLDLGRLPAPCRGDCPHRVLLLRRQEDDGEASDNAMDTTPIHNDASPVVYIYAQDWRQYVGRQMEVRVAQSLGDEIEVERAPSEDCSAGCIALPEKYLLARFDERSQTCYTVYGLLRLSPT